MFGLTHSLESLIPGLKMSRTGGLVSDWRQGFSGMERVAVAERDKPDEIGPDRGELINCPSIGSVIRPLVCLFVSPRPAVNGAA